MAVELHTGARPVVLSSILRSRIRLQSSPLLVRFSSCPPFSCVCLSVCLFAVCVSLSLSHTHILSFLDGAAHIRPLTQKPGRTSEREGERETRRRRRYRDKKKKKSWLAKGVAKACTSLTSAVPTEPHTQCMLSYCALGREEGSARRGEETTWRCQSFQKPATHTTANYNSSATLAAGSAHAEIFVASRDLRHQDAKQNCKLQFHIIAEAIPVDTDCISQLKRP